MKKIFNILKNIFFFFICFVVIVIVIISVEINNKNTEIKKSLSNTENIVKNDIKNNKKRQHIKDLEIESDKYDLTIIKAYIVDNQDFLYFKTNDFIIKHKNNNLEKDKHYAIDVNKLNENNGFSDLKQIDLKTLTKGDLIYITITSPTNLKQKNNKQFIANMNVIRIDNNYKLKR